MEILGKKNDLMSAKIAIVVETIRPPIFHRPLVSALRSLMLVATPSILDSTRRKPPFNSDSILCKSLANFTSAVSDGR